MYSFAVHSSKIYYDQTLQVISLVAAVSTKRISTKNKERRKNFSYTAYLFE